MRGLGRWRWLVAALLVVAGCSGDNDEDEPVDNAVDHGGEDSIVPGGDALEARLLTLDDLPDGWLDLEMNYTAVETCGMRTEMPVSAGDQYPVGAVAFALDEDSIVADVFEKIVEVPIGEGQRVFQNVRDQLGMCGNGGEVDGLVFAGAVDLAVPALGDESVARRVTIETGGISYGIDVQYVRAGDRIVGIGVAEPAGETDRLVELAALAVERATATGTSSG